MNVVLNTADTAVSILPPESAAKFERLVERRRDLYAVVQLRQRDLEGAWAKRDARERDRALRVSHFTSAGRKPNPEDLATFDAALTEAEKIVADRKRAADQALEAWRATDIVEEVKRWLSEASRSGVKLAPKAAPPPKTTDYHRSVENLLREIDRIETGFASAEAAPRPVADLKASLFAELDRLVSPPSVRVSEREGSVIDVAGALRGTRLADGRTISDNGASFLLWACRDVVEAKLLSLLPKEDAENAMSDDKRDEFMGRLADERLSVERQLEAVIVAAEGVGLQLARRRETDPRAVLEVEIVAGRVGRDW